MEVKLANKNHLEAIIQIQKREKLDKSGQTISWVMDVSLLEELSELEMIVVVIDNEEVKGFTITVPLEYCKEIPYFDLFFKKISQLQIGAKPINITTTITGQTYLEPELRGSGAAYKMYLTLMESLKNKPYEYYISDVDERNKRSIAFATKKKGHTEIGSYFFDEVNWKILAKKIK